MSNSHPALAPVFKRFKNYPLSSGSRGEFYEVHRCFVEAARGQGFLKTVQDAADLIGEATSTEFWNDVASRHGATFDRLRQITRSEPHSFVDDAIQCLLSNRPADAIRCLGEIHGKQIANFGKYRALIEDGPDRGLAIWQVVNPYYYVWAAMPPARADVSEGWRSEQFDTGGGETAQAADSVLTENQHIAIKFLREQLGADFWAAATVLECGCGDGQTAGMLVRHLGVRPSHYRGFDLHGGRVEATKRVLAGLARSSPGTDGPEDDSIFVLDALAAPTAVQRAKLSGLDMLLSASFTNVFPDDQLVTVLDHLLVARPAFIVDISVNTSWGLCVGRSDPSAFYRNHGYRVRASRMETPHLAANESHRIWMPERYWSNRCIFLYEHA